MQNCFECPFSLGKENKEKINSLANSITERFVECNLTYDEAVAVLKAAKLALGTLALKR